MVKVGGIWVWERGRMSICVWVNTCPDFVRTRIHVTPHRRRGRRRRMKGRQWRPQQPPLSQSLLGRRARTGRRRTGRGKEKRKRRCKTWGCPPLGTGSSWSAWGRARWGGWWSLGRCGVLCVVVVVLPPVLPSSLSTVHTPHHPPSPHILFPHIQHTAMAHGFRDGLPRPPPPLRPDRPPVPARGAHRSGVPR